MTIASEQGFAFPLAMATFFDGWVLTVDGSGGKGIAQMQEAQASLRTMGADVVMSYFLGMIAEAHCQLGQLTRG
jgi:hypothetical protein